MSQYGAFGFAQRGWSYDRILAHYYPGTQLGSASLHSVRVRLAHDRSSLSIGSHASFRLVDGGGRSVDLAPGAYALHPDLQLDANGTMVRLTSPVRFMPGMAPLELLGRAYRGTLFVTATTSLSVINVLGLEDYLLGVVPMEMPAAWASEALKAQAVAARSYAVATRRAAGSFDLEAGTSDQVYGGVSAEDKRASAAVNATRGQVLLYQGQPAATFFFSTSGGRTASAADVWPGRAPTPYLTSVDDPYDAISPYHQWGPIRFTDRDLATHLGAQAPLGLRDLTVAAADSGRVASVTASGASSTKAIAGGTFASLVGLRSSWFSVSVLTLEAPVASAVAGHGVPLSGIVRGLANVRLEQQTVGGKWQPLDVVTPAADGSFEAVVTPAAPALYRLTAAGVVGPAVRVSAAPV